MRSLLHSSGASRRHPRAARARLAVLNLEGRIVPHASVFQVTKLVSDQAGVAQLTDPNLVNAWGLAFSPTSPFWVANNGTNTSTLYNGDHVGPPAVPLSINSLVVTLPGGAPTGAVFNSTANDFVITDGTNTGKAAFIFVTEGGEIVGWSPGVPPPAPSTQGQIAMTVAGAIFKGVTIGQNGGNNYLYATDFHNGVIDVFDGMFNQVTLAGNFTDPHLPAGYAPFNIMAVGDKLYVTYAKQDAEATDELHGVGLGFVDVFNTNGTFNRRLVQHGLLDAPWGMAIAPSNFGSFGGALLVGNFGNGQINAYNPDNGHFLGSLRNAHGQKIKIDGLWGLAFGNGGSAGDANALYFTAGPADESHGLFGSIRVTPRNPHEHEHDDLEAVGADQGGGPHVKVFDESDGEQLFSFMAYNAAFHGGVRVAVGDINGDGTPDIVTAPGRGGGPDIRVFDGTDGHLIREFMAFDQSFRGGVNVATGDVDGDGFDDIIVGADAGGGPHVKVFSGADNSVLQSFMAFDLAFTGGVRVAAGDINFDGLTDVITAAGVGGGPQVKAFDAFDHSLVANFFAFNSALRGGIFVAAGDVNGDGAADIVVGAGSGMTPQVAIFDPTTNRIGQSFAAYAANFTGGVRVAVRDSDDDGHADIITGAGHGGGPHVRLFNGDTLGDMHDLMAFDNNFRGGVFVG
jgi:uncharacterized protein (TIGR03118 family)